MNGYAKESPLTETGWSSEWTTEVEAGPFETSAYESPVYEGGPFESGPYETTYELRSPFLSATNFGETTIGETNSVATVATPLASPFLSGFVPASQQDRKAELFEQLSAELENEAFEQSLTQLVNEAAGHYMASEASWSSERDAPAMAAAELERWIQPLANQMEQLLEDVSNRLAAEEFETLRESELDHLLESMRPQPGILPEAFENLFGGFFSKIKNVAKGAWNLAKKGVEAIGKILPIGLILDKIKGLIRPLLNKVLKMAIGQLPSAVQPLARNLAQKLQQSFEMELEDVGLAREFDIQVASLMLAPSESEAEQVVYEVGAESANAQPSTSLSEIDTARERLAQQLAEMPAGEAPVAQLEQFIPAVMALLPIIKMGLSIAGRDRIVRFLADKLAGLIRGMVGDDAAKALARPIVDTGLRMLHLEVASGAEATLGAEALVSTVEDTVRHVMELPAEAFEDTLRMEAEVQQAFAEAAARHVPTQLLRAYLPERETAGEGGVWILMPRGSSGRRFRQYACNLQTAITRQIARHIATTDGGTLETYLLDRGVVGWPVNAEVQLFETLPGTQLGHIAQSQSEAGATLSETLAELQPFTPEAAAMLIREPGLGRALPHGHDPHQMPTRLPAGTRLYRLRLGHPKSRHGHPSHRFVIDIDLASQTPQLRVHVRLSERDAQQIASQLEPRGVPGVIASLKERYVNIAPRALARRLLKHPLPLLGKQLTPEAADRLSRGMVEGMTGALTKFVATRQQELGGAVRDAAQGITLTFTFAMPGRNAPSETAIAEPALTVRPGWHGHSGSHG